MQKNMFIDEPPEDRFRLLTENCEAREKTTYMKDLTQEELDIKREQHIDNCIVLRDLEEDLKKIKDGFKAQMDPIREKNKTLLSEVKSRKEEKEGWLFTFFDRENSIANVFDENGEFVSSRRMLPAEKQAKLFISKAVSE